MANRYNVSQGQFWTITAAEVPTVTRYCKGCKGRRPYFSSGKFRVNANGGLIDAWLIYWCAHCDRPWNRAIFRRQSSHQIGSERYLKVLGNDADYARSVACSEVGLKAMGLHLDPVSKVDICRDPDSAHSLAPLTVELRLAGPVQIRLDRLVARALGVSRSRFKRLFESGQVTIERPSIRATRQLARDGQRLVFGANLALLGYRGT